MNVLSCYVQCKRTKNTPNIEDISNACPYKDKPMVIFWHKESATSANNEFVLMPKNYFYELIKK